MTIMSEHVQLELIAPDQKTFDYWCDAIDTIQGQHMKSEEMKKDLDLLLGQEIRLRLLDLEDVKLPDKAPAIPPLPPLPVGIY